MDAEGFIAELPAEAAEEVFRQARGQEAQGQALKESKRTGLTSLSQLAVGQKQVPKRGALVDRTKD